MRRTKTRLAIACMCAVATAVFTGAALAGNGNDNAPGQVKQDGTPAQPAAQVEAQTDLSVSASASTHVAQGQAKQGAASTSSTQASSNASANGALHSSSSTQASSHTTSHTTSNGQAQQSANANPAVAGMKPANNTGHWTTCGPTGGSSTAATCTAGANATTEARVHTDSSKRYGNSQTAAQIAVSRGGTGVMLTGPGNSQPHKVAVCPHKKNPSGGVDVHAIKSYGSTACAPAQSQQVVMSSVCGSTTVTTITTTSQTALHGKGQQLGKGNAKHQVISTSSSTQVTPTGQVCTSSTPVVVQTAVPPVTAVAPVTPATAPSSTAAQTTAGSVLGTQTALAKPKAKHANHGVLGTVTRVSGSTLP